MLLHAIRAEVGARPFASSRGGASAAAIDWSGASADCAGADFPTTGSGFLDLWPLAHCGRTLMSRVSGNDGQNAVGNKRPPKQSQFKPGQSGNPAGRQRQYQPEIEDR